MTKKWSIVIVVLLLFEWIQCQIISGPEATADLVGTTNVELHCTVPTATTMVWYYYPHWAPTGYTIYDSNIGSAAGVAVNFTFTKNLLTDWSSNTEYVLGIKTLTAELAVLYVCSAGQGVGTEKILADVLAMNYVLCPSLVVYTEGDIMYLACTASYHYWGSQPVTPTLSMLHSSETRILNTNTSSPSGSQPDLTLTVSVWVEMLAEYDNTWITCTVNYQLNPPTYERSCITTLRNKLSLNSGSTTDALQENVTSNPITLDPPVNNQGQVIILGVFVGVFGAALLVVSVVLVMFCIKEHRKRHPKLGSQRNENNGIPTVEHHLPSVTNQPDRPYSHTITQNTLDYSTPIDDGYQGLNRYQGLTGFTSNTLDYSTLDDSHHGLNRYQGLTGFTRR